MKLYLILILSLLVTSCSDNEGQSKKLRTTKEVTGKEAREVEVSPAHEHKEVWTCPMHPQVRKDGPGKCPICHMDLVKVEDEVGGSASEDIAQGHATVKLTSERQQLIGVETGVVVKKPLFKTIEAPGKVAFDPELYTAQTEFIEAIRQKERVKDSTVAEVKHSATRMVQSARLRLKVLGLSDQYINSLARSGVAGSSLLVPKAGEKLWVYAEVFEMDLPYISPGNSVKVSGSALESNQLIGKVVSVDRVINPDTRTARVRILIPDTKANLRPESYLNVSILSPLGEEIAVPFTSVFDTGKEAWVFVVEEDRTFKPQLITIKERAGDMIAVSSGVVPGQKIVTSANFLIDSESRLKGAFQESMSEKKQPECPEGQYWHTGMSMCMDKP
jgi:Cu(I)/Ag(I) efflux system membrane fusion protein